jgi:hypothetical protein
MKGISAQSLGPVTPYIASLAAIALPFAAPPTASTIPVPYATSLFADAAQLYLVRTGLPAAAPSTTDELALYIWDRTFPELVPDTFVIPVHDDIYQSYEPFIASEGWREIQASTGPFVVEEDEVPRAYFDQYDLSAIALYEHG